MRNNWLVRTGLLAVLASLAVSAPVGLAVPPPLDITEASVVGGLDSRQKGQVGERLKYWGRQSVDADPNDANAIIDARTKALLDYSRINTVAHQDEFARQAAGILTPLLQSGIPKDDKLLSLNPAKLCGYGTRKPIASDDPSSASRILPGCFGPQGALLR